MERKTRQYTYETWAELFQEISYANEAQYPPIFYSESTELDTGEVMEAISFYKLTLLQNGETEYKGHKETFNPKLWWKVKLLVRLFQEDDKAGEILFGS